MQLDEQQEYGSPIEMDETQLAGSFAPIITVPEAPPQEEQTPLAEVSSEFDPRHRDNFVGLLYLGKLEDMCTIAGHRFRLATPNLRDRLAMGPLHKTYANTVVGEMAWRTITVAAYLREIDGQAAPEPLNSRDEPVAVRLRWVLDSIHSDEMIGLIYQQALLISAQVHELTEALDALGEASA